MDGLILILVVLFSACFILGIIDPSIVIRWGTEKKQTRRNVLIYFGIGLIVSSIYLGFTINRESQERKQKANQEQDKVSKNSNTGYNPSTDERKVLSKHYVDMNYDDQQVLEKLEKKYDSFNDEDKSIIKNDIERIRNEKIKLIEENKKQIEDNKQTYADFIQEVENTYSSMKVHDISGKDKTKTLDIDMILLNNLDATYGECAKLTLDKETKMKEVGINKIIIMVNDKNGENQGILSFELESGKYKSKLNTFSR